MHSLTPRNQLNIDLKSTFMGCYQKLCFYSTIYGFFKEFMLRLRSFNINLALGVIVALDAIFSLWKVNFEVKILDLVLTQDIYNV